MISVVIPLYNKARQIETTMQSVLAQSYADFEVVVVDDGSTDGSAELVEQIGDSRIRVVRQANAGVSAARNRGIAEAKGEFVALLDGDDLWKPNYLATQAALAAKYPECDVFAVNYEFQNTSGDIRNTVINRLPFTGEDGVLGNYFEVAACSTPPICSISIMTRKGAFESVDGFPVGIKSGEDLITWARLACRYKIAYSRKVEAVFVFDQAVFNEDQRRRDVSLDDEVGTELKKLLHESPQPYLRQYIALWYKMRTRICLDKRHRFWAIRECLKSMRYSINLKIAVFFVLCFMPQRVVDIAFKKLG